MTGVTAPSPHEAPRRSLSFKASRVRWPEWVVAISALVLLVSFLGMTWFTFLIPSGGAGAKDFVSASDNGWRGLSHAHWLLLITILAAFALFLCQAMRRSPAWAVTLGVVVVVLGALTTIWLIVRVPVDPPGGRNAGGWVALVSAAVLTWAAYRSMGKEGIDPEDGPGEIPVVSAAEMANGQGSARTQRDSAPDEHS